MVKCVIDTNNFDQVLSEIKLSNDAVFDFSGTNFAVLGTTKFSAIFVALGALPQSFALKLNYCALNEHDLGDQGQLRELTLGLSSIKNLQRFEFVRSLSRDCNLMILEKIAESLLRNHEIKSITIDGFRVTPPHVCEALKNHPTVFEVIIDGLPKVLGGKKIVLAGAANESVFDDIRVDVLMNQKRK